MVAAHDSASAASFYLAAATVIPVLALGGAVVRNLYLGTPSDRLLARSLSRVVTAKTTLATVVLLTVVYGWGEFTCLRALEVGHAPFPGAPVVWIACGLLAVQFAWGWLFTALIELWPNVFSGTPNAGASGGEPEPPPEAP
jgi:hypothetical protein